MIDWSDNRIERRPHQKMAAWHTLASVVAVGLLIAVASGCATKPTYFRDWTQTLETGASLAVLPPVNFSRYENATDIVTNALIVELLGTGTFEVVDPGLVEQAILEERLRLTDRLPLETLHRLQNELGVTHVMVGSISEFGFVQVSDANLPTVSISLRIVKCADGHIAWAATHSKRGDDVETVFGLGRIHGLEQLASVAVKEMTESLRASSERQE